jgi:hypothetical protein
MPDGAIIRTTPAAPPAPLAEPPFSPFSPRSLEAAMQLADFLCRARTLPAFLHDNPADMLMVIEQAARWRMSPFSVAQCAYQVRGKLGFEGKLVHAAIESSPLIVGYIDYAFNGTGIDRTITVSATRRGETQPRAITVRLADVRTTNEQWARQPDQMLCYAGVRIWARRYAPTVLAGVYSPDEFDVPVIEGTVAEPMAALDATEAPPESTPTDSAESDTLRAEINAAIPLDRPQRPSVRAWLEQLSATLERCSDRQEVERELLSETVCIAGRTLKGAARERLRAIMNGALERHGEC